MEEGKTVDFDFTRKMKRIIIQMIRILNLQILMKENTVVLNPFLLTDGSANNRS
jgi:hypothetical protein